MDRTQKEAAVAELTEGLKDADAIFAVDYRGISVTDAAELRGKLREADAVFKVVKNRLAKRAAADSGTESLDEFLVGPTALTLINGDAVIAAKAIADFAKEHEELEYKGGIMDGAALDPEGFQVIAKLPGVDVLRGQLVGIAASPITGLVRGLGSMMSGLAIALGQIAEQGLVTGEAPAEEEPAAEEAEAKDEGSEEEAPEAEAAEEPAAEDTPTEPEAAEVEEADEPAAEPEAGAEPAAEEAEEPPAEEPAAEAEADDSDTSQDESEEDGETSSDESEDQD
jgi:large subunit ribosomal protein L10